MQVLLIGLGAGIVSALLFVSLASGSLLSIALFYLAPLPIMLAGLGWNVSGAPLPGLVDEILATLGQAVVPVCLVLIGVSLAHYGARGAVRGAVMLSLLKLVAMPLVVFAFARFALGLGGTPLAIVVMLAALPVGSNALIFAQRYRTLVSETSTAIVVSTVGFVATAPAWLALLAAIG